jgi:hypothetical protein
MQSIVGDRDYLGLHCSVGTVVPNLPYFESHHQSAPRDRKNNDAGPRGKLDPDQGPRGPRFRFVQGVQLCLKGDPVRVAVKLGLVKASEALRQRLFQYLLSAQRSVKLGLSPAPGPSERGFDSSAQGIDPFELL